MWTRDRHFPRQGSRTMQSVRQTYRQVFPVAAALTVAVLAAGCGEDLIDPPPPVPTTITIAPETATLVSVGETVQRTATVHDQHGAATTGVAVTCSSRDPSVVTVSSGGLVTAEGNGTTAVEASAGDAVGSAAMTTEQRPAEVRVSPPAETLVALGDTVRLSAEALDANGHAIQGAEFTWASGDESVLTVDGKGLVMAVGRGSATVTATTGQISGTAELTVDQRPFEVRVSSSDTLAALGATVRLSVEALDANGHALPDADFTSASADASVVTVDSMGLAAGGVERVCGGAASVGKTVGDTPVTVWQRAVEMRLPLADTLLVPDTVRLSAEASDVKVLLEAGADATARSDLGNRPLHVSRTDDVAIIEALLDAGADLRAKNDNSERPVGFGVGNPRDRSVRPFSHLGRSVDHGPHVPGPTGTVRWPPRFRGSVLLRHVDASAPCGSACRSHDGTGRVGRLPEGGASRRRDRG